MVFHHARGRCATVALVLISCVLIAACDSDGKPVRTAHEAVRLIDSKRLLTCTHLSYRPFEFRQGSRVVGFDVDMIDLIAEELGVRREVVDTPFEGIQSGEALNSRTCDIAAAAMTITPARRQSIAFSTAYFDADQALLVRKRSHVDEFADLEGLKLGVLSGTTGQAYADKHARPAGARLKNYESLTRELRSVGSGQVAAAINDLPVLLDYAKHHADVRVSARFKTAEQYGFGMRKTTSERLRKVVNHVIARARADGTYDRFYRKWFGAKPE